MKSLKFAIVAFAALLLVPGAYASDGEKAEMKMSITEQEVMKAQETWGEGIVHIGKMYTKGGDYVAAAEEHINSLYAYEMTDVLFKPTKAAEMQFRTDYEGALSYFVGNNSAYKEDGGFAINPWTDVRFENKETFINGNTALAMGNYYFTTTDGDEVKVEYSFGYVKDENGDLRIVLHHSSIPFQN